MALMIDIENLLSKQKVESNRVEFKEGWNPDAIYHSICAFANDLDNLGGGYILVGVKEVNGVAERPVLGVQLDELDEIQKSMTGFNNKFDPYYLPRTSVEEVDGKNVFVIWAPAGANRPYEIPTHVTVSKNCPKAFYVRSGTSSIEAKGEVLDELRDMASRVPFDERGNPSVKLTDISPVLVYDYLRKVGSKLVSASQPSDMQSILEQMNLFDGPVENRAIKNVAAMMFCENPQQFFPVSRVEIVIFPDGREQNPDNIIELSPIEGPVTKMIADTLTYLKTNVVKEAVVKQKDSELSLRYFNYPYQALEEAVVNALFHRDYKDREPVEITIEPDKISILSHSGPDRSISREAIKEAKVLRSRRYRNRRLGEFLKELELTEGRATGIPTIQRGLALNGSGKAAIDTDDERTYFLIDIPCHPEFYKAYLRSKGFSRERLLKCLKGYMLQVNNLLIIRNFGGGEEPKYIPVFSQTELEILGKVSSEDIAGMAELVFSMEGAMPIVSLMHAAHESNRSRFRNKMLTPLLTLRLIEMTIPDKPNSRNQQYKLTDSAYELLAHFEQVE
ncbi:MULTISPECIES: helix-turn-helix domain-containing protein [unclassified Fibrobacter]|uniref:AlbA family DNA-binding domain-containing protein n=1 Tax=unclassified Fibrobacter TaxID=2634177 RepID=UPI000915BC9F|nr:MULTISPECIES: RNA-binding domain-containing protein [unclassified Fibrobacter]SHK24709.1 ATP-dependent DNA helicase RecG [Fibrobacter sp. UWH6]SHK42617.1 ATP-dependent DNA helicase RecG [Fibrobacter sp. UWH5]